MKSILSLCCVIGAFSLIACSKDETTETENDVREVEPATPETEAQETESDATSEPETEPSEPTISEAAPVETEEKIRIMTTFYPTQYFTERMAGNFAEVVCPVPMDQDPIFWMPDSSTIEAYQQADLIVLNGAGFAQWVTKVTLPESRIVDTARGFESEFIHYEDAVTHTHGPDGEHTHEGIDGHTWVDPVNAIRQAEAIRDALIERYPDYAKTVQTGFEGLKEDLEAIDERFKAFAEAWGDRPLLASHPAYNYVAKRYNLNIHNLDIDPETIPDEKATATIEHDIGHAKADILMWEAAPTADVETFYSQKFDLRQLLVSPGELLSEGEQESGVDYLHVMKGNLDRLEGLLTE